MRNYHPNNSHVRGTAALFLMRIPAHVSTRCSRAAVDMLSGRDTSSIILLDKLWNMQSNELAMTCPHYNMSYAMQLGINFLTHMSTTILWWLTTDFTHRDTNKMVTFCWIRFCAVQLPIKWHRRMKVQQWNALMLSLLQIRSINQLTQLINMENEILWYIWRSSSCHRRYNFDCHISRVCCQKGPTRYAYAWLIGPFWQDTLHMCQVRYLVIDIQSFIF